MNKELLLGLICGLLMGTGCATSGYSRGYVDYAGADRDFSRAQHTVDNWLAKPAAPQEQHCRTYEFTGIYGQTEMRTDCE